MVWPHQNGRVNQERGKEVYRQQDPTQDSRGDLQDSNEARRARAEVQTGVGQQAPGHVFFLIW